MKFKYLLKVTLCAGYHIYHGYAVRTSAEECGDDKVKFQTRHEVENAAEVRSGLAV